MKKILIIGASSFIGINLLYLLKKKKRKNVYCTFYKNFISIFKYFFSIKLNLLKFNIFSLPENINTIVLLADIKPKNQKHIIEYSAFLKNLKKYIIKNKISRIIFISSGSVYENKKKSLNAKCKINAEKILLRNNKKFKTIVLRIFFPYGQNQKKRMIPNLIENLKFKKKINILDDSYMINPTHVYDIVKIILNMIYDKNANGIYNVFNHLETINMHQMCQLILGKKTKEKVFLYNKINYLKINYTYKNLLVNKKIKLFKNEIKKLL